MSWELIVVTGGPTVATLTDMMQPLTGPEESGPGGGVHTVHTVQPAVHLRTAQLTVQHLSQGQVSGTL